MAKRAEFYHQCRLRHDDGRVDTSWIPSQFAEQQRRIALDRPDGTREEGWTVAEVFNQLPADYVEDRSRDHLRTRAASDR